ncbi:MAG TPA: hypothetical protein VLK33_03835 [Terriglobales bacterium]|nr:hypothetical protein [Terriglobales bacterium]
MALVVVGGHSRNVGKTSVVAGLISALPEFKWTAMKITQYGHNVCSSDGEPCHCATADHTWTISEEKDRTGSTDTSRFLVAGADRVWWVRSQQGHLAEALPNLKKILASSGNAILESNSIVKFVRPDIYLTVLDPETADFKQSAQEFLDRADAIIMHKSKGSNWERVSLKPIAERPVFPIDPPQYVTTEIVDFVRSKLNVKVG